MTTLLPDIFEQSVDFLNRHDVFHGHAVAVAEDEVVLLLMHVLDVDFSTLNNLPDEKINHEQLHQIKEILSRRVEQKTPMIYLLGFAVFAGLKFKVDERVLIPRSPFVELIDTGFEPWLDLAKQHSVMDMCTGSGCIGLAIANYFPQCRVDLVDVSQDALQLAVENAQLLQLSNRVECINSDLFSELDNNQRAYDLIVANPPYVDEGEYQELPEEYLHEPKIALVSAQQGMELPVKILLQAPEYMSNDGYLFLEVGYNDEVLNQCLPTVPIEWLDFELGGQGICVFNRADLLKYRAAFKEFLRSHVT